MISVLDLLDDAPYASQRAVRDEVAAMDNDIRRRMDAGLSPDEMKTAQAARAAAQAASLILEKLFK